MSRFPSRTPPPELFSCADALQVVAERIRNLGPPGTESVPLEGAVGRVLAADLGADRDQPPFPRSTRDGYAVCSADLPAQEGRSLTLLGAIRAGEQWTGRPLAAGEAIETMTGAPVPAGADAILMVEHADLAGERLTPHPNRTLVSGENIVPQGAEAFLGDTVLHRGTRLTSAEIALAASVGAAEIAVFACPTVAILATGDELVGVSEHPGPMQIRNSNSHGLAALALASGATPYVLPPAADARESLLGSIQAARKAPMLILTGGVSAGKYDLVEEVLLSLGAEFFFTGVRIQPGKPAVFGRIPASTKGDGTILHPEQWIFGLPGNPISTQVTATLFAMPLLRALGGEANARPFFAQATLAKDIAAHPGLTRFLPAYMECDLHGATVKPTGWKGSGDLHANSRANCYLVVPPDLEKMQSGDIATVLLR